MSMFTTQKQDFKMKNSTISFFILLFVITTLLVGEIKCIIKMVSCNWEPIGKAEAIYTIGTFTGLGSIIGYLDIQDK